MIEVQTMHYFKTILILLVATSFAISPVVGAQDTPPAPRAESMNSAEGNHDLELGADANQEKVKPATDDQPSSETQEEQDKSADNQDKSPDNEKPSAEESELNSDEQQEPDEKKSDEQQESDEKQSDEKKSDEKKSDEKQESDEKKPEGEKADEKKPDEKKADGEKDEDEKSVTEKAIDKLRTTRGSRDDERLGKFSKQSKAFVKIFEPVVASVNQSTLTIVAGKRPIALGTVVDSNGLILTKASELRGSLGCRLNDGTILEAKVIGIDPETDLALLKIDAENLNVAQWSDDPSPITGRWLATPKGSAGDQPTIGIVSVDSRHIPPSRPFIGIQMEDDPEKNGVRIVKVISPSPADFADVWVNDVIVSIDDEEITDRLSLQDKLRNYDVNDRITIGVLRGEKKMNIRLTLAEKDKVSPDNLRSNLQNSMGSILSRRRKDFPDAFQHDSMLSSKTCGGPIVDLSGKIVGINIARAGRVSSLALPASVARKIVELLKTGKLAPEVVNKAAIEKITVELEEMKSKFSHLPDKKSVLERKYNVEKARLDELNKSIADLRKRMKLIEEKSTNYKSELGAVRKQITNIEKNRERLEADREQLRTGSR